MKKQLAVLVLAASTSAATVRTLQDIWNEAYWTAHGKASREAFMPAYKQARESTYRQHRTRLIGGGQFRYAAFPLALTIMVAAAAGFAAQRRLTGWLRSTGKLNDVRRWLFPESWREAAKQTGIWSAAFAVLMFSGCTTPADRARLEGTAAGKRDGAVSGQVSGHTAGEAAGRAEAEREAQNGAWVWIYIKPFAWSIATSFVLGIALQPLMLSGLRRKIVPAEVATVFIKGLRDIPAFAQWERRAEEEADREIHRARRRAEHEAQKRETEMRIERLEQVLRGATRLDEIRAAKVREALAREFEAIRAETREQVQKGKFS